MLPLAPQAAALPSTRDNRMVCLPPANCRPIGNCEFCCAQDVVPDSANGYAHDTRCPAG
ncbi:hypothetical protein B0J15DRAFT_501136 [Fusarium solani]|uniref:Uncharacterized protein n=1 Tax=Fusarium solani TaxID=169388 RepID=A0A9P9GS92_FUSSL|nr:uncharacterized protein B0J15DRAFT_501136 [Fusarium solani]KAH7243788.1 hypothetical protein B0J15DRAFT_501136 [Fusarium solani]